MNSEISRIRRHYTLLLLFFVNAVSLIDRQIMGVLVEPIQREFGVSNTAMGLLTGVAFAFVYCIVALPFGRYADRANRRNFIGWSCGVWSLMTLLCGLATQYWHLAIARIGVAAGESGSGASSISIITDLYPPTARARAMSLYMLGAPIGAVIGLGVGARIAFEHGWRAAFIWMAIPGIMFALLIRLTGVEPRRGVQDPGAEPGAQTAAGARVKNATQKTDEPLAVVLRDAFRSRPFMGIVLAGTLLSFSGYAYSIWGTAFLMRTHGVSLKDAGLLMGLVGGVGAIFGSLFSGWLCDRLAQRDSRWQLGVPIIGMLIALPMAIGYALYPAGHPWLIGGVVVPRMIVFVLGLSVFSVWWLAPTYAAIAQIVPAHRRATMVATYNFGILAIGAGLGPLAVGVLSDVLTPVAGGHATGLALAASACGYLLGALVLISVVGGYARSINATPAYVLSH
ncbi:spinster family MFS transporter [Pandoraea terrae]|nr:MFS transporter [Pandoraea terrae]